MEHHTARMIPTSLRTNLPVLLFHNLDHSWPHYEIAQCLEMVDRMINEMQALGHPLTKIRLEDDKLTNILNGYDPNEVIVFNWCEEVPGVPRSSWMVAQELERQGFTYTGADYPALALSQDKRQVQQRLKDACIPTPEWKIVNSNSSIDWEVYPAIVKPAFEHYSMGIVRESVVQSRAELIQRVSYVIEQHQQPVLLEEFIDGREFHVGVIGNGTLEMLPPAEIDFSPFSDIHDRLCTYEANFDPTSLAYQSTLPKLPIDFTAEELSRLEDVVLTAYRANDCRDYARMDVRMRGGVFYTLDVNPNADIGPDTSLIKSAEMVGYSYGMFGSLLVNLAAARHPVFGNGIH